MFKEIADSYKGELGKFTPYQNEKLPSEDLVNASLTEASKYLNFNYPSIPATVFMNFTKTGNRVAFEDLNFARRYAFNALVIGEYLERKHRFTDDIINGLYAIMEESTWCLPPHNSYKRSGPNYILPDTTRPVIDLFAAESGALLATANYLLADEFDSVSPFISKSILDNLKKRIYEPYIYEHFWWMGNGDEPMCNWTVWCTQNILLSVFLMDPPGDFRVADLNFDEFKRYVFNKACASIDSFLKDYGDDGCCDEGAHYYKHSALSLFNCMEVLNAVSNGAFNPLYQNEKLRNMATFILKMHVHGKYFINYADCSPVIAPAGAREFLFGQRINDAEMMRFSAWDYKNTPSLLLEKEVNLFYHLENLYTADELLNYDTDTPVTHPDVWLESAGVFVARDNIFTLAMKGGDNDDSHNHNDTGSFTIYKNGKPLLIDVGVESYTAKTFSKDRYTIWTMQSQYHNLPTINGVCEEAGPAFKAVDVKHFFSKEISDIRMDIAPAFPKGAKVKSYIRHASLYKGRQIVIEDEVSFSKGDIFDNQYFVSLMLYDKPVVNGNNIELPDAKIEIMGDAMISVETINITDERLKTAWDHDIYRVMVMPRTAKVTFVIS